MLPQTYTRHNVIYQLTVSDFNKSSTVSADFPNNPQIRNLITIRPVTAELCHAERRTGKHGEASSSFSQFYKRAPKLKEME
jgi:hypothetical protein